MIRTRAVARSVQIEIAHRLGHRFFLRLTQRLVEPLRQRIPPVLLRIHRLLEDRLAARRFRREDALRVAQLRLVAALRLPCATMTRPRLVSITSTVLTARARPLRARISVGPSAFPSKGAFEAADREVLLQLERRPVRQRRRQRRSVICVRL